MTHNSIIKSIVLCFSSLLLFSCEKIIELTIEDASPKLVIEGAIEDNAFAYIKLSLSTGFYDPLEPNGIENAVVVLNSNEGETETLEYISEGLYRGNEILGQLGKTYTISITHNSKTYTASATIPKRVKINNVVVTKAENKFGDEEDEEEYDGYYTGDYHIEMVILDDESVKNYYRLLYKKNNEYYNNYRDISVMNDDLFNGNAINLKNGRFFSEGEIINVEIRNIDKSTYEYLSDLEETQSTSGNPMGATTPYNPEGNFGPEVLGYFGAWTVDYATVKVQ